MGAETLGGRQRRALVAHMALSLGVRVEELELELRRAEEAFGILCRHGGGGSRRRIEEEVGFSFASFANLINS